MFICLKNATRSRIPGAESGRGTPTTFRLLKESVLRPTDFPDPSWRESWESRTRGRGRREQATPCNSGRTGWSPRQGGLLAKAEGAGTARQRSSGGQRLGSRPPRPAQLPLPGAAGEAARVPPGPSSRGRGRAPPPLPRPLAGTC